MATRTLPSQLIALIQHIKLNEAGWWEKSIEQIIRASMWTHGNPLTLGQICDITKECSGIELSNREIESSVENLRQQGDVFNLPSNHIALAQHASDTVARDVEKLESDIKASENIFYNILDFHKYEGDSAQLWNNFRTDVIWPLISELGAATYYIIKKQKSNIADLKIVKQFLSRFPQLESKKVQNTIQSFILSEDASVKNFLLSQMTASFCATSCNLNKTDLNRISCNSENPIEFTLFLDTNFIYSILQLHDNTANDAADALLNLIHNCPDGIKIKAYVLPTTIDETKSNLHANYLHVRSIQASQNISQVGENVLSGVLKRYFRTVGKQATMGQADQYFKPYIDNLISILRDKGIELYNQKLESYRTRSDVIDDINNRISHESQKHGDNGKRYETLLHDIILWHVVTDQRNMRVDSIVDAKFWIATIDYSFLGWDEYKRRSQTSSVQVCLHPSSLVQMLQLWVPRDAKMENALLDTLRLPFFHQEFDAEAEKLTISILETISHFENASSLSADAVEKVVVNNALRSKIALTKDEKQKIKLVKDAFVDQNKLLESKLEHANRAVLEKSTELIEQTKKHEEKIETITQSNQQLKQLIEQINNHKLRRNKLIAKLIAWIIVILIVICIIAACYYAYPIVSKKWSFIEPIWAIASVALPLCLFVLGFKFSLFKSRTKIESFITNLIFSSDDKFTE